METRTLRQCLVWALGPESSEGQALTLYHGTTAAAADAIGEDLVHLRPGSWLTSSREWAEHYAKVKAEATGDTPAVLEFNVPIAELTQGGLYGPLVQEYLYRLPTMPCP